MMQRRRSVGSNLGTGPVAKRASTKEVCVGNPITMATAVTTARASNPIIAMKGSALLQRRLSLTFQKTLAKTTFRGTPASVCIADPTLPDCPIVAVSLGFEALTGYQSSEVIGRNCRFLNADCEMSRESKTILRTAADGYPGVAEGGASSMVVVKNRKKCGQEFDNLILLQKLNQRTKSYVVGIQIDVTEKSISLDDPRQRDELKAFVTKLFDSNLVPWAKQELQTGKDMSNFETA
jgi:PAS domain S-box-containing protein